MLAPSPSPNSTRSEYSLVSYSRCRSCDCVQSLRLLFCPRPPPGSGHVHRVGLSWKIQKTKRVGVVLFVLDWPRFDNRDIYQIRKFHKMRRDIISQTHHLHRCATIGLPCSFGPKKVSTGWACRTHLCPRLGVGGAFAYLPLFPTNP
jgi:hypothetical protein